MLHKFKVIFEVGHVSICSTSNNVQEWQYLIYQIFILNSKNSKTGPIKEIKFMRRSADLYANDYEKFDHDLHLRSVVCYESFSTSQIFSGILPALKNCSTFLASLKFHRDITNDQTIFDFSNVLYACVIYVSPNIKLYFQLRGVKRSSFDMIYWGTGSWVPSLSAYENSVKSGSVSDIWSLKIENLLMLG